MTSTVRLRIGLTVLGTFAVSVGAFMLLPAAGVIVLGAILIYLGH